MSTSAAQPRPVLRRLRGVVAGCALLGAMTLVGLQQADAQLVPSQPPAPIRGLEVTNHLGEKAPLHVQFKDEQDKLVSLGDFFDRPAAGGKTKKPVIVQMMYFRCPLLCPEVLKRLTGVLNEIDFTVGKDFDVLLVSVDPTDTPLTAAQRKTAELVSYNRSSDAVNAGWHFLTSTGDSARQLADAIGFPYRYMPASNEYSHGAALFVLTPEGKVSRYLLGLNYPAKDVRLALLEASGGKIGTAFDSFTLWCYHFDPETGTYKFAMGVMRGGAGLTLACLGGLLFGMWRFEMRCRRKKLDLSAESPAVKPGSPEPESSGVIQVSPAVFGADLQGQARSRVTIGGAPGAARSSTAPRSVSAELTGPTP